MALFSSIQSVLPKILFHKTTKTTMYMIRMFILATTVAFLHSPVFGFQVTATGRVHRISSSSGPRPQPTTLGVTPEAFATAIVTAKEATPPDFIMLAGLAVTTIGTGATIAFQIKDIDTKIDSGFNAVNTRVDTRFNAVDTRINEVETRFNNKFEEVHQEIVSVRGELKVTKLQAEIDAINAGRGK